MSGIPENVRENILRARWRADLLALHAHELRRIAGEDNSPVAAGLAADAEKKEAEADLHKTAAQVELELAEAKAASHANPKDQALRKKYAQAAQEMVDMRSTWRAIGEAVGNRRFVGNVDSFPEPSVDELLGGAK